MLIPLNEIQKKYNLNFSGVIQVGAHWAEEHHEFIKCGITKFVYIEPSKVSYSYMKSRIGSGDDDIILFNVACGAEEKDMVMYVSHQNQGQSNSLLQPNLHLQQHPEIVFDDAEVVKMIPLDKLPIQKENYDLLVMDVQGFEGEVLKGSTETLQHIKLIMTEVNKGQTYLGNMEIDEMDAFLSPLGFERVETYWPSPNWTWGDAIYLKK